MPAKTPARNAANFLLCALAAAAVLSPVLATAQQQPQLLRAIAAGFYLILLLVLPLWILALPVLLTTDPAHHPHALLRHAVSAALPPLLLLAFNIWLQVRSGAILYRRPTLTAPGFPPSFLKLVTTLSFLTTALYLLLSRHNRLRNEAPSVVP